MLSEDGGWSTASRFGNLLLDSCSLLSIRDFDQVRLYYLSEVSCTLTWPRIGRIPTDSYQTVNCFSISAAREISFDKVIRYCVPVACLTI